MGPELPEFDSGSDGEANNVPSNPLGMLPAEREPLDWRYGAGQIKLTDNVDVYVTIFTVPSDVVRIRVAGLA